MLWDAAGCKYGAEISHVHPRSPAHPALPYLGYFPGENSSSLNLLVWLAVVELVDIPHSFQLKPKFGVKKLKKCQAAQKLA